jgi:hypothetical protein
MISCYARNLKRTELIFVLVLLRGRGAVAHLDFDHVLGRLLEPERRVHPQHRLQLARLGAERRAAPRSAHVQCWNQLPTHAITFMRILIVKYMRADIAIVNYSGLRRNIW